MRCLGCQYNLKNLAEHRCPECGRAFDPNDLSTFDQSQANNQFWLWAFLLMILSYAATLLFFCAIRYPVLVKGSHSYFEFDLAALFALFGCPLTFVILFIPFLFLRRLFRSAK